MTSLLYGRCLDSACQFYIKKLVVTIAPPKEKGRVTERPNDLHSTRQRFGTKGSTESLEVFAE